MTSALRIAAFLLLAGAFASAGAPPKKRPRRTPTPVPTPTETPLPLYRAAGFCMRYDPGHFLVLAELGQAGRVFHIDGSTVIASKVSTGARLRVEFIETPEGPLARRISPGPVDPTPTPRR
jgi:hypothetical protein